MYQGIRTCLTDALLDCNVDGYFFGGFTLWQPCITFTRRHCVLNVVTDSVLSLAHSCPAFDVRSQIPYSCNPGWW